MDPKQPKKASAIAPSIFDNVHFAAAASTMRVLENGLAATEAELDALHIEAHLGRHRSDRQQSRPNERNKLLQDRLEKHRATNPGADLPEPAPAPGKLPREVAAALEIIRGTRPAGPPQSDRRRTLIASLEDDAAKIREAIGVQRGIVDALRDELSGDMAQRLMKDHQRLVLAIFRAAQGLAFAADTEAEFRKSVVDAGYIWRADICQGPQLRGALVLGSESTFDSDISRARRMLEELKIL